MAAPAPNAEFAPDEYAVLHRVARTLLKDGEYGELLAGLLDVLLEALGAERGCVIVQQNGDFQAAVARNFTGESLKDAEAEVSTTIAGSVLAAQKAQLIDDASSAAGLRDKSSVKRLGLRSVLCAPLFAGQEVFALLYLENRSASKYFQDKHRRLLDEICAMATPRLRVAVELSTVKRQAEELNASLGSSDGILTADPALCNQLLTARQVAPTDLPVLIQGETGTGKELIARSILRHSRRARNAFVVVNCGAIPASLIESELFGHVRGAFTGAHQDRIGLIGAAHRGTLFLDEIGELPLELQARLLRALQSGEVQRIGANKPEIVDLRIIAATNRDLAHEVEKDGFRRDLYYRIAAVTLEVPPLRNRPNDIPLLVDHYLRTYSTRCGKPAPKVSAECLKRLCGYSFPGNVRELEFEMARIAALHPAGTTVGEEELSERVRQPTPAQVNADIALPPMSLEEMEKHLIVSVLRSTDGNRTRAAEVLRISREGLRVKMQRLGIS